MNLHELFPHGTASFFARNAGLAIDHPARQSVCMREFWTEAEIAALKSAYSNEAGCNLDKLSSAMGRSRAAIACKAEELKLTSARGKHTRTLEALAACSVAQKEIGSRPEIIAARSKALKDAWARRGHPRGMLGKNHAEAVKDAMSKAHKGRKRTHEAVTKGLKTRFSNFGTLAPANGHLGVTWKQGWREIAGRRIYFRSRWEFNYGLYLEFIRKNALISAWEHEPETFWFDKIKRGCRSYLPDFKVTLPNGKIEFHEVKGWMDDRSKTKIKRMAKYHPSIVLRIIDGSWFRDNKRKLAGLIPEWESDKPLRYAGIIQDDSAAKAKIEVGQIKISSKEKERIEITVTSIHPSSPASPRSPSAH